MDPGRRRTSRRRVIQPENLESTRKEKEKPGKKTTRTKESAEEGPLVQKPVKIKVRMPEPEPEDFVQKIRMGTTREAEAKEEEPTETLERHTAKRGQEQRAKEPAPMVAKTQQQARELTLVAVETQERVELRAAQSEAATD